MSIYLLQFIYKWFSIIAISITSLFNGVFYSENLANNLDLNQKETNIVNDVTHYTTNILYDSKLPSNITKVVTPGQVGLSYKKDNEIKIIQGVIPAVVKQGTGANGLFTGRLTGYGAGCAGCSKTATVACRTESGKSHSLTNDGIYYEDDEYGKVRILAAAQAKFPCGTIVEITKAGYTPFYGVVLDRGGSMNNAWANGTVWMDLAYESNAATGTDNLVGRNINFSVQRWGW